MKQPLSPRARAQHVIARRRKPLVAAISAAVLIGAVDGPASAQDFPAVLPLSSLDGNIGFKLDGSESEGSGLSVSAAGDVNGDDIDDLIVGAPSGNGNGVGSGRSYVVFGRDTGFPATVVLSALDGSSGFRINGETAQDVSGFSVSGAGDVNGDGIDDLIIGAMRATPNGTDSGRSYVVFGRSSSFPAVLQLAGLNGTNGFKLNGEAAIDTSGYSVSGAGDINGDGIDDVVIGAPGSSVNGPVSGRSYVVFGRTTAFPIAIHLSALNGTTGFKLDGEAAVNLAGFSVSAAGDINNDGIDDLVIGAQGANSFAGRSYVVFGRTTGFPATLQLSALDGGNGFALDGDVARDYAGFSVSAAGDVNGDGIDDLIVGARGADPNGSYSGCSYVLFGRTTPFPALLELSGLAGSAGFRINGEAAGDRSGQSVSGAGDINGDGIDDLIIGAFGADPDGSDSGRSYVVFGRGTAFPDALPLSGLSGGNGFKLDGEMADDQSGVSVSAAGDVNGDGIDDVVVGAHGANNYDGRSYVVFGRVPDTIFGNGFEPD